MTEVTSQEVIEKLTRLCSVLGRKGLSLEEWEELRDFALERFLTWGFKVNKPYHDYQYSILDWERFKAGDHRREVTGSMLRKLLNEDKLHFHQISAFSRRTGRSVSVNRVWEGAHGEVMLTITYFVGDHIYDLGGTSVTRKVRARSYYLLVPKNVVEGG
jgi:hypothetical protein